MALTNKERQEAHRKRMALLGQKRKEFYLTDDEAKRVKLFIEILRLENG